MKRVYIFAITLVVFTYLPVSATVINIPDDYSTIQQGIDASTDGDTVLVQSGEYVENINFNGHNITLGSLFLTTGDTTYILETVIDGDSSGSVVTFENSEDSTALIIGFTIQNGYAQYGGGIYCDGSEPQIRNNYINDNITGYNQYDHFGKGGGIFCRNNSSPIIQHNIIRNNVARPYWEEYFYQPGKGGGIYSEYSNPMIIDNLIIGNSVYQSGYSGNGAGIYCENSNLLITNNNIIGNLGDGLYCDDGSQPIITSNVFRNNSGNAIRTGNSSPEINGNLIIDNSGSGIHCGNSFPLIVNNTISGNLDSGIRSSNSTLIIVNTLCWFNLSSEVSTDSASSLTITYCDIRGGWEGEGNIDSDPLFEDPEHGNYNICSQSPCIDAGDPDLQDPDGTRSDIGVFYEVHPECEIGTTWHVSTLGDDETGDGSGSSPFRTIQHAVDIGFSYDTISVENGTYDENINIYLKNILIASQYIYSGDSLDVQNTIIDGGSNSPVITVNRCGSSAGIVGLTIRNGSSENGGGISCIYSSPGISSNIILNNLGSGIFCTRSSPIIKDNMIVSNHGANLGGGINCEFSANAIIINNVIEGNSANLGGGIYCGYWADPVIDTNTIIDNSAAIFGGGIYLYHSDAVIRYNIISENSAENGGGIWGSLCEPAISHNDILDNIATANGGGICFRDNYNPLSDNSIPKIDSDIPLKNDARKSQTEDETNPNIFDNLIAGNSADNGGGLYSIGRVITNTIVENSATSLGGGIYCNGSTIVKGNTFMDNSAPYGAGIYSYYRGVPLISLNVIKHNHASTNGGGIFSYGPNSIISNNTIYENTAFRGGGIFCGANTPTIDNNIVSSNHATYAGGIFCVTSIGTITNTICWGDSSIYGHNEIHAPNSHTVIYSNIQGGWEGEGNIDVEPLFRDPENGDFHLMSTDCGDPYDSPCIDAGHPDKLDSLLDCSWGLGALRSDMGAYGGGDSTMVGIDDEVPEIPSRFALAQNYPNPFNASTIIQFNLPSASDVIIEIYDILGRRVETLFDAEQPAGYHQIVWDASDQSSGIYFYRIQAGEYSDTRKMVLLK